MLPNLKLLRKEYGISQQVLADMMGVSQQSINQYENHSIEPDIALLTQMACLLYTSRVSVPHEARRRYTDYRQHGPRKAGCARAVRQAPFPGAGRG